MSTMEVEQSGANNPSDGSSVVTEDEGNQKGITVLDELLQDELKEDSVDCFIKRVGAASEDGSEFGLNYDVSGSAFYSPKEMSTDNNSSSLEKELEMPSKTKEVPQSSGADLQSDKEENQDDESVTNTSVEETEGTKEVKETDDDVLDKIGSDSLQEQEGEKSKTKEEIDSEAKAEIDKEDIAMEDAIKEMDGGAQESTVLCTSSEVLISNEVQDSTSELLNSDDMEVSPEAQPPSDIQDSDETLDSAVVELPSEILSSDEVQDSSVVKEPSEPLNSDTEQTEKDTIDDQNEKETNDNQNEKETSDDQNEKDTNDEQNEKDTNDDQNEKVKGSAETHKDVLYLVFQPKSQANTKNDDEKDNEEKNDAECKETSPSTVSIMVNKASHDKPIVPVTKTLLTIGSSSDTKTGKELNKAIIVKKITAKIIKGNTITVTKPTKECEVNHQNNGEENVSNTQSTEPQEKEHYQPQDDKEIDGTDKTTCDDTASVITVRKVYERKKRPKVLEEEKTSNLEDGEAQDKDTQNHHTDVVQDENSALGKIQGNDDSEGAANTKDKDHTSHEEKTMTGKLRATRKINPKSIEKKPANFGTVKRKIEEICRVSREEEDGAIKEIKKMKKETLDVLRKINAEMGKLKQVFLTGK